MPARTARAVEKNEPAHHTRHPIASDAHISVVASLWRCYESRSHPHMPSARRICAAQLRTEQPRHSPAIGSESNITASDPLLKEHHLISPTPTRTDLENLQRPPNQLLGKGFGQSKRTSTTSMSSLAEKRIKHCDCLGPHRCDGDRIPRHPSTHPARALASPRQPRACPRSCPRSVAAIRPCPGSEHSSAPAKHAASCPQARDPTAPSHDERRRLPARALHADCRLELKNTSSPPGKTPTVGADHQTRVHLAH